MAAKVDYHAYMASREWRLKRKEAMAELDGWCARCLSAKATQVHHLTYERLGDEDVDDLLPLCRACHEYVSGERDDDPMVEAVRACIVEHGLDPVILDKDNNWARFGWWASGPTPSGTYFQIDIRPHGTPPLWPDKDLPLKYQSTACSFRLDEYTFVNATWM